jgi:hypothetical protein
MHTGIEKLLMSTGFNYHHVLINFVLKSRPIHYIEL